MQSSSLRAVLAALPQNPTDADLAPAAAELASACRERAQPRKSLALYLRNAADAAPAGVLQSLSANVIELLERGAAEPAAAPPRITGPWADISEAAAALRTRRQTLLDRVKLVRYRRLYGWVFWDGHQWWFPVAALDSTTRAAYMATLPSKEPPAHVAMLPDWCEREPAEDAE